MKLRRSVSSVVTNKVKQLRRQVASVREVTFADDELISLAAEAWGQWREAISLIRRDGLVVLCQTQFDQVMRKHPAVEAERQFHAEYVARLFDLQLATKEKKALKAAAPTQSPAQVATDDPLEGLRVVG